MNRGLSLYLDLLRLVASVEVVLFHLGGFPLLGGDRTGWNAMGHEAVVIFFVLSGYVIRHAAGQREQGFRDFAVARLTRVYSVAIPALALTLLFDRIGQAVAPQVYVGLMTDGSALVRLLIGALMLNESWSLSVQMLSNTPYWSIAYEFWCYFLFAGLFYFAGWRRWAAAGAAALLAGYKILILFPIWAMGWFLYARCRDMRVPRWMAALLFVQPALLLTAYSLYSPEHDASDMLVALLGREGWRDGLAWSRFFLTDTLLGVSVALHILGAQSLDAWLWRWLGRMDAPIRFLAGRSFTLYLIHQPAMLLTGALLLGLPLGAWRQWVVLAAVGMLALVLGTVTEGQRHRLRPIVERGVDMLAACLRPFAARPLRI